MLLMSHTVKAKFKNQFHFSKEIIASMHSSQVVVQGSPLVVRNFLETKIIFHAEVYFSLGTLSHYYVLA